MQGRQCSNGCYSDYIPTPEQIAADAAEIRKDWPPYRFLNMSYDEYARMERFGTVELQPIRTHANGRKGARE